MRYWKLSLFTTVVFSAFIIIFLYTACERNVCDNVTCFNGGSCNVGVCNCPLGWEDPQCQTKTVARFLGNYAGFTTCDMGAEIFDTAQVAVDNYGVINLTVALRSQLPKVLHGYVNNNGSTYAIAITNNDSTFRDTTYTIFNPATGMDTTVTTPIYFYRYYTVTLQSDSLLVINYYERYYSPTDTIRSQCTFRGNKF